jgi:hypothetical protein
LVNSILSLLRYFAVTGTGVDISFQRAKQKPYKIVDLNKTYEDEI